MEWATADGTSEVGVLWAKMKKPVKKTPISVWEVLGAQNDIENHSCV